MKFFHRKYGQQGVDLDTPLLYFSRRDKWSIRDAVAGLQIFGAVGSGKTSGSGASIARAFLKNNFGGIILTAKVDECDHWQRLCEETGRLDSLMIFGEPDSGLRLNFLDYFRHASEGGALTENLVNLFMVITKAGSPQASQGGSSEEQEFWNNCLRQLLRNTLTLLSLADQPLSLPLMHQLVLTAPMSEEQLREESWQKSSFCWSLLCDAELMLQEGKLGKRSQDYQITKLYWLQEYPNLGDKTRSSVTITFTSLADLFLRETLRELFCTSTNIVPELTHHGVLLVVNLPVHEYQKVGLIAQLLWKYLWQKCTERRKVNDHTPPCFLWIDESQYFLLDSDQQFLSTSRSARAATVLLTQNISNYYVAMGGKQSRETADSLLGLLSTTIFHANTDSVTNNWASQRIGETYQHKHDSGDNRSQDGTRSLNHHAREELKPQILPHDFQTLRSGGFENRLLVDAIVSMPRIFRSTRNTWIKTTFKQV